MKVLKQVEKVFGELKNEWRNFNNCGVRHVQDANTKEITIYQSQYIQGIHTLTHADLSCKPAEDFCSPEMHQLYWSILGAISFATLTRVDIAVVVAALQRHSHQLKYIHGKRLNTFVRWAQRNPKVIHYRRIPEAKDSFDIHLRMYSDAAFKKEEDTGHSMRGAIYMRCLGRQISD